MWSHSRREAGNVATAIGGSIELDKLYSAHAQKALIHCKHCHVQSIISLFTPFDRLPKDLICGRFFNVLIHTYLTRWTDKCIKINKKFSAESKKIYSYIRN